MGWKVRVISFVNWLLEGSGCRECLGYVFLDEVVCLLNKFYFFFEGNFVYISL